MRIGLFLVRVTAAAAVLATGTGCGSGSANGDAAVGDDGAFLTCETDPRSAPYPYQPGMMVTSDQGDYIVRLMQSVPGPPVKGTNTWTIAVSDAATDTPIDGLDVSITPWMPDHAHGSREVVVTPAGGGSYSLAPVYLYMSGYWEVKFQIVNPAAAVQTIETGFIPTCIP